MQKQIETPGGLRSYLVILVDLAGIIVRPRISVLPDVTGAYLAKP